MTSPVATKHTVEELLELAFKDELTGLYNRRYLNDELARRLSEATADASYAFLLIDIDFFKNINDTYGHASGDLALQRVAGMLESRCGVEDMAIRFAGDEFVVLLADAGQGQAIERADAIVAESRELTMALAEEEEPIRVTLSVGVAAYPEHGENWRAVLEAADQALYQAKNAGRDRAAGPPSADEKIIRGDDLSHFFPCAEFIGREEKAERLQHYYRSWCDGQSEPHAPIILCNAQHGLGKTRFLHEFDDAVRTDGDAVVYVTGAQELKSIPHGCLVQSLVKSAASTRELRDSLVENLPEEDHPACNAYFGEEQEEPEPVTVDAATRMFNRALRIVGGEANCVLLVDDLETIDESTQAYLRALHAGNTPDQRFFIVATSEPRDDLVIEQFGGETDGDTGAPACMLLKDLDLPTIGLGPLDAAGTANMVAAILPTLRVKEIYLHQLHQLSGGNYMYIEEALKYLIQVGRLVFDRSAWQLQDDQLDDLPRNLRDLVARRFDECDPEIRSVLAKASVMDGGIQPELLAKMEDSDAGYTLHLLDKARRLGILEGGRLWEDDSFHFHSDTTKTVTHDKISEDDKVAWHGQFADLLDTLPDLPALLQLGTKLHHSEIGKLTEKTAAARDLLDRLASTSSQVPAQAQPQPQPATESRREFKLPKGKQAPNNRARWPEPDALDAEQLVAAVKVFAASRAAVQQTRLYPRSSDIVRMAYKNVHQSLENLFETATAVDYSEADGGMLVNGELPTWKPDEASLATGYCEMMTKVGLNSVSFARGIAPVEIEILMNTWIDALNLECDHDEAWYEFISRPEIQHVDINTRVYIAYREGELPTVNAAGLGVDTSRVLESKQALEDVIDLLKTWTSSVSPEIATDLSEEERSHIGEMLGKLRDAVTPGTAVPGAMPAGEPEDVGVVGIETSIVTDIEAKLSLDKGADGQSDPVPRGEAPVADSSDDGTLSPGLQLEAALEAVTTSGSIGTMAVTASPTEVPACISDLVSGEASREERGREQLTAMGREAIELLYRHLTRSSDARECKVAAEYLGKLDDDLADRITKDLQRKADMAIKRRLLQFAVPVLTDDERKQQVLIEAMVQEKAPVAVAAVDCLVSENPEFASTILLDVMPACREAVQSEICANLGRLRDPACIAPLVSLVADWPKVVDDEQSLIVCENACYGLGYFDSPEVTELLEGLIIPPSQLPWKKKPPSRLRNAALTALVMIGGDQVRALLTPYADDKDPRFRMRVRKFLRGEQDEQENAPTPPAADEPVEA